MPGPSTPIAPLLREGDELPDGYERRGPIVGRRELLDDIGSELWAGSEFVARSRVAHTTSAVEATLRRRHLERLVEQASIDPAGPTLELGCGDGLVTRHLLELGFGSLLSTDIVHSSVERIARSLSESERERVQLVVDDLMRLPLDTGSFRAVIAWGVLSVSGDFDAALERAWSWVEPGGHLLLAEPLLESVLAYALARGDVAEFRRTFEEGTRAAMWDRREDRYPVHPARFYEERLAALPDATVELAGGVSLFPSLVLGGLFEERPAAEDERAAAAELLADPRFDELTSWRQAFWLVRRR